MRTSLLAVAALGWLLLPATLAPSLAGNGAGGDVEIEADGPAPGRARSGSSASTASTRRPWQEGRTADAR